jgi:hypothetical protein
VRRVDIHRVLIYHVSRFVDFSAWMINTMLVDNVWLTKPSQSSRPQKSRENDTALQAG